MGKYEYSFSLPEVPEWMKPEEWEGSMEYEIRKCLEKYNVHSISFSGRAMTVATAHALADGQIRAIEGRYGFHHAKRLK